MIARDHASNGEHAVDLAAYFARIGYRGSLDATFDVLAALQAAHIAGIPFEAIDAFLGEGVVLDPAAIDHKLLHAGRGGYCYEQNGLFRRVLGSLGFAVEARIARVLWGGAGEGAFQPRTHMALLVEAAGARWLVDVGFGSAVPIEPLRWDSEAAQDTRLGRYRLVPTTFGRRLDVAAGDVWKPLYEILHEIPRSEDFEVGNWFTSTHPASPFRRNLIISRATSEERITMFNAELTFRSIDGGVRRELLDAARLEAGLGDIFNLRLDQRQRTKLAQLASRTDM